MAIKPTTCCKITKESWNAEIFGHYFKPTTHSQACADQIVKMILQEIFV